MPGRPGRSGGHNRKSAAEHRLEGTYRSCRHGDTRDTPDIAAAKIRINDLGKLYRFHRDQHKQLRRKLTAADALDRKWAMRELRQQAATAKSILVEIERLERQLPMRLPSPADDPFAEFDDPSWEPHHDRDDAPPPATGDLFTGVIAPPPERPQ